MSRFHCVIFDHGKPIAQSKHCEDTRALWRAMDTAWQHANSSVESRMADDREDAPSRKLPRRLSITKTERGWTVDEPAMPGTPPVGRSPERWEFALINYFVANAKHFGFEFDYFDQTASAGAEFPSDV